MMKGPQGEATYNRATVERGEREKKLKKKKIAERPNKASDYKGRRQLQIRPTATENTIEYEYCNGYGHNKLSHVGKWVS